MPLNFRALILVIALIATAMPASAAQDTVYRYYNGKGGEATQETALYYRKAWKTATVWAVRDYFHNGRRKMQGAYTDTTFETRTGPFIWYDENTGIRIWQGSYKKGLKEGTWKAWTDTGTPDFVVNYFEDEYNGNALWYHENGQLSEEAVYKNDELVKARYFKENGSPDPNGTDQERKAAFVEHDTLTLQAYLVNNLEYPSKAQQREIEGRVYVSFTISVEGAIGDAHVAVPVDSLLDAEALRVVKGMPRWTPGFDHNRLVKSYMSLPVVFKLE